MRLTVSVPATTANLGPGYDRLGLALQLRLRAEALPASTWSVLTEGEGADYLKRDDGNLIAMASERYWELQDKPSRPLAVRVVNPIPLGRGLGSSAAAIVAGMALAQLATGMIDYDTLFHSAAAMEGHPDNIAPAVYGGLQVVDQGTPLRARRRPLAHNINLLLVIPEKMKSTDELRAVVPPEISPEDEEVTATAYRAVLSGLGSGDPVKLAHSADDRRHQPYRLKALPESARIFHLLQQQDHIAGVYLSGAGTTVAGWVVDGSDPGQAVKRALADQSIAAAVRLIRPDWVGVRGQYWN
ncbi:MAG: homoserine kinase [Candidatus Marinimicrobia bacterium]|nr:homoserine kinase [Candidatus Neomarinimicrobiota bacterium]